MFVDESQTDEANNSKRNASYIDLTRSDNETQPPSKRQRLETPQTEQNAPVVVKTEIELTAEQESVVNLALAGRNLFLTGAGGSGKTVALKEILRRLGARRIKFQAVAPTGIAALPLDGKTIHSFMGWKPDTLRRPIDKLVIEMKPYVRKGIRRARVLIIEEISMVENQFLERMNYVLQAIVGSDAPFGGKQVILLGDFHQLPPVKPFEFCLQCGGMMSKLNDGEFDFVCSDKDCLGRHRCFVEGDKWAFKAPVWQDLRLRHIQLQRIHRQKDKVFKDILTNIRRGTALTPEEWDILESPKPPPPHNIYPVRLMSRRTQVAEVNRAELQAIQEPMKTWHALDSYTRKDPFPKYNHSRPWETDKPLENNRLLETLHLKKGAKVILLHNLDQKRGLVNGSQGEVVGFLRENSLEVAPDIKPVEGEPKRGFNNTKRYWDTFAAPVVKFANGMTRPIFATDSTSQYGTKAMPYLATRVQVPLTLAWALTIHKSQGMTLDYIEVSSQDIFETGQFYVALSRGTNMDGVTVTGFSRDQLPLDEDVVEFYRSTKWEVFADGDGERGVQRGIFERDEESKGEDLGESKPSVLTSDKDVGFYWDPAQPSKLRKARTELRALGNREHPNARVQEKPGGKRDFFGENDSRATSEEPEYCEVSKYFS